MFMDVKGTFSLIKKGKEEKQAYFELNYEYWIGHWYYKESTKFGKLNNFRSVQ